MSDVTVLLLTFFMLTGNFIKKEPVQVVTPGSVSEIKIPETNILQILVEPSGKIFMSLDKQQDMAATLQAVGEEYGLTFTPEEIKKFSEQDKILKDYGIPCDSVDNQFKSWIRNARMTNRDLRIAIKADQSTPYSVIKNVMSSLQDLKENRYNLITSLKKMSDE